MRNRSRAKDERLRLAVVWAGLALLAAGCGAVAGVSADAGVDAGADGAADGGDSKATFVKPTGYASVTFFVDDTANRTYAPGELRWMGSFIYDPAINVITHEPNWGIGVRSYPPLYDDGPILEGGHEMHGATAGDHIFSTEVYVAADPEQAQRFDYGLIDAAEHWLWCGEAGSFVLPAGSSERIHVPGFFIKAFGSYDLKLVLDTAALDAAMWPFDPQRDRIAVRGSMIAWGERELADDGDIENSGDAVAGDGKYTYLQSANLGPHDGLLNGEQRVQFVFRIGERDYRTGDRVPPGLSAATDCDGAFAPVPIFIEPAPRSGEPTPTVVICEPAGQLAVGPVIPPAGPTAGGVPVAVYGAGFEPGAEVWFSTRPATEVEVIDPGQINCRAPAGEAGPAVVRVILADGEYGELGDGFRYRTAPPVEVLHAGPDGGPTAGGTTVTVSGKGFAAGATVAFGGEPAEAVEVVDPRQLVCTSPAHPAGSVSIAVTNPDGAGGTLEQAFTYSDETDPAVDWAVLQEPLGLMLAPGENSPTLKARMAAADLTEHSGCHQQVQAELGWGPPEVDPAVSPDGWSWVAATCDGECAGCGAGDAYRAWLEPAEPGLWAYAFRFSRDGGRYWTVADSGAGSRDGFQPERAGRLLVQALDAGPLIRGIEPAAASVLGGTPATVLVDGLTPDVTVEIGGQPVAAETVGAQDLVVHVPAHPAGPVDVELVRADGGRASLHRGLRYVQRHSPRIDGLIDELDWPAALLVAGEDEQVVSDWGPNGLQALWVAYDEQQLYLAVTGWVDAAAGNAIVLLLDVDYGAGSGVRRTAALIDESGYGDTPGLDAALSGRLQVTDPAFGAEFGLGTVGLAAVDADQADAAAQNLAGLRALAEPTRLEWLPATVATSSPQVGQGAVEFAIPWTSLFAGGLPDDGARLGVCVRLVSRDGDHAAAQGLPPPADRDRPAVIQDTVSFEVR